MSFWVFLFVAAIVGFGFWLDAKTKRDEADRAIEERDRQRVLDQAKEAEDALAAPNDVWETIDLPPHRPKGKWVNWKFGSGWIRVRGTSDYEFEINTLLDHVEEFDEELDKLEVILTREQDNPYDTNAILVSARFTGSVEDEMDLGYVEREAAEWLAENYDPEMPIAAEIVRLNTNYEHTSIRICGFMPGREAREAFKL